MQHDNPDLTMICTSIRSWRLILKSATHDVYAPSIEAHERGKLVRYAGCLDLISTVLPLFNGIGVSQLSTYILPCSILRLLPPIKIVIPRGADL